MIFGVPTAIFFVLFGIYLVVSATVPSLRKRLEMSGDSYFTARRNDRGYSWRSQPGFVRICGVALILLGLFTSADRLGWF